jgi:hypothetical protein
LGEDEDAGSGVGSADADAVEASLVAQGDLAADVDAVSADAVVRVAGAVAGDGFRAAGVDGRRGGAVRQGAVWPVVVVLLDEPVQQRLQLGDGGWLDWLAVEPLLEGLLEPFDFAAGGGWFGGEFFCTTPSRRSSVSKALRPPRPPASRVVKTVPLSVSVEAGIPYWATVVRNVASTIGPVIRRWAVTESAWRAQSSSQDKISTSAPGLPSSRVSR